MQELAILERTLPTGNVALMNVISPVRTGSVSHPTVVEPPASTSGAGSRTASSVAPERPSTLQDQRRAAPLQNVVPSVSAGASPSGGSASCVPEQATTAQDVTYAEAMVWDTTPLATLSKKKIIKFMKNGSFLPSSKQ